MPNHRHSRRSHSKSAPNTVEASPEPARNFPIVYVYFILGGLLIVSLSVTAIFLFSTSPKPITNKPANSLRTPGTPLAATSLQPQTDEGAPDDSATPAPSMDSSETQAFALRPSSLNSSGASSDSLTAPAATGEDGQRKDDLADLEFRAKNYSEAERLYRGILSSAPQPPLVAYRIFVCLLLQNRPDEAEHFLTGQSFGSDSPALYYCKATRAFLAGDTATAQKNLDDAKRLFPGLSPSFDPTLRQLGYLP